MSAILNIFHIDSSSFLKSSSPSYLKPYQKLSSTFSLSGSPTNLPSLSTSGLHYVVQLAFLASLVGWAFPPSCSVWVWILLLYKVGNMEKDWILIEWYFFSLLHWGPTEKKKKNHF